MQKKIGLYEDYIANGKFVWRKGHTYSGGNVGGATEVILGFGVKEEGSFAGIFGSEVAGEVYIEVSKDGTVTTRYQIEKWKGDKRTYREFATHAEFKEALMSELEPIETKFTKTVGELLVKAYAEELKMTRNEGNL